MGGICNSLFCGKRRGRPRDAATAATHADKMKCPVCGNEMAKNSLEKQPPDLHARADPGMSQRKFRFRSALFSMRFTECGAASSSRPTGTLSYEWPLPKTRPQDETDAAAPAESEPLA